MSGSYDYIAFGLRIRSAIAIPGAMMGLDDDEPEIEVTFGSGAIGPETGAEGPYRVGSYGFEFAMQGIARFVCLHGAHVLIEPAPAASEDGIAAMLIATVIPALLWARGDMVLHAAAFADPRFERAVAVAGPSGAGKSSLLARAMAADARAIADDSVRLRRDDHSVSASGLPGGWYGPVRTDDEQRRFSRVRSSAQLSECPLGHILILTPGLAAPLRLRRADAFKALLNNRHRPRIARLMRREAAMLPKIAAICSAIPVIAVPMRRYDVIASLADIVDDRCDRSALRGAGQ